MFLAFTSVYAAVTLITARRVARDIYFEKGPTGRTWEYLCDSIFWGFVIGLFWILWLGPYFISREVKKLFADNSDRAAKKLLGEPPDIKEARILREKLEFKEIERYTLSDEY